MKNETTKIPPLGRAELEAFFGKIFKNYRIAFVGSDDVFEVSYDAKTRLWMRTRVSRMLVSSQVFGYLIDRYLVIWKAHSDEVLLATELDDTSGSCLLTCGDYDFALRGISAQGMYTYMLFKWNKAEKCYEVTDLGEQQPKNVAERPYESHAVHNCQRLYIKKEGIQCTDNSLFYGYITKYWEN